MGIARFAQHLLEQADIDLLVVDDEDAGGEDVGFICFHRVFPTSRATSSASMNSFTRMGLVR
jgi:hypothetical protein